MGHGRVRAIADDSKAANMRRNLTYGLLVLFMVFLITANPSGTGENGRNFFAWLSTGWDDTREFVGSFIGDESADDPDTNEFGEVVIPTVAPAEPAAPAAPAAEPAQPTTIVIPTATPVVALIEPAAETQDVSVVE